MPTKADRLWAELDKMWGTDPAGRIMNDFIGEIVFCSGPLREMPRRTEDK